MAQANETSKRSCVECHRRKIKCDKLLPCSYCVKVKIECCYPPPRQSREKNEPGEAFSSDSNADVVTRIDRIERTLESLERNLSQISQLVLSSPSSQPSIEARNDTRRQRETDARGSATLSPWGAASIPFHRSFEANPLDTPTSMDIPPNSKIYAPTLSMLSLWQIFLERVDPVLKMIHVPTVQKRIMDTVTGRVPVGVDLQALMGSVCYSAVVTMSVSECWSELNKAKEDVLSGYRTVVENALTLADFLHSTDTVILQAFTLYIVCGRFDKRGPDVKNLTSVAINIAQKNGLHELDNDSTLSPFEKEIRSRIWWQLYTLDVRNAEDHGLQPFILENSTNTKLPRNINDMNLHPDMDELPRSSSERSEMIFTLDRHEISTLVRRIVFSEKFCHENSYPILSVSERSYEIDTFREGIEMKILSLCNPNLPIDFITATSSRLVLAKLKLSVIKPKTRENQHIITQEGFRNTCIDILKNARALRLYEKGRHWLWLFQTYVEWDALAYLFINLSLVPSDSAAAWQAADDIYNYWKSHSEVVFDHRWKQIEDLCSQALLAKQMYRDHPAQFGPPPKDFEGPDGSSGILPPSTGRSGFSQSQMYGIDSRSPVDEEGYDPQPTDEGDIQGNTSGLVMTTDAAMLGPNPYTGGVDLSIPSSGTGCQWSAALFERYFHVLDSEHNMALPWL